MKRFIPVFVYILTCIVLHATDIVVIEKETLKLFPVGSSREDAQYNSNEEGFFSPNGPIVYPNGNLVFLKTTDWTDALLFANGEILADSIDKALWDNNSGTTGLLFSNQQGVSSFGGYLLFMKNGDMKMVDDRQYLAISRRPARQIGYSYALPNCIMIDYPDARKSFTLEYDNTGILQVREVAETRTWLSSQPGGFTIGSDGLLYRNGILYSAIRPKGTENYDWRYLGRLASGHAIWAPGPPEVANMFKIVDSRGNVELDVKIVANTRFSYGLGPWGEFYYLFAPPMDKRLDPKNDYYRPEPGVPAELAVYRSHLKYFGRLNDSNVRLRKDPSTSAEILGTYPAKTGFRIIEKGTKQETIGGKTDYWYHVRLLDGKEGWFFGTYIVNLYDGPGTPPPWPNVADW